MLCAENFVSVHGPTLHLRLAAALQLLHWAAIKLGSRSRGLQPWLLMLASTLLWACTRRGCRLADQSWWQLGQWADTWMLPALPCWLPEATASDANAISLAAGHLLHTICMPPSLKFVSSFVHSLNCTFAHSQLCPFACSFMHSHIYSSVHMPASSHSLDHCFLCLLGHSFVPLSVWLRFHSSVCIVIHSPLSEDVLVLLSRAS